MYVCMYVVRMARTKIGKHWTISEDVVRDIERNAENQSEAVEQALRDAGWGERRLQE